MMTSHTAITLSNSNEYDGTNNRDYRTKPAQGGTKSTKKNGSKLRSFLDANSDKNEWPNWLGKYEDLLVFGPGGSGFIYIIQENIKVGSELDDERRSKITAGPGESGFK